MVTPPHSKAQKDLPSKLAFNLLSVLCATVGLWGEAKRPQGVESDSHSLPLIYSPSDQQMETLMTPHRNPVDFTQERRNVCSAMTLLYNILVLLPPGSCCNILRTVKKTPESFLISESSGQHLLSVTVPGPVWSTLHTWSHSRLKATLRGCYHYFSDWKVSQKIK